MPSSPSYRQVQKTCQICKGSLKLNNTRDIERKKYCSERCKGMANRLVGLERARFQGPRICLSCNKEYIVNQNNQKYCSSKCVPKSNNTTEAQYKRFTNPRTYFVSLLAHKERAAIEPEDLLALLEIQQGRCALTGVELTFKREKGTIFRTNASIDRIQAGGPYIKENVRLVCSIVNKMRLNMTDEELSFWCKKILEPEE